MTLTATVASGAATSAAVRGGAVTVAGQAGRIVVGLVAMVALGRLLTPADFGLFAMAVAVVGVADLLRDFGLSTAALQAADLSQGQKSNLFWINTVVGCACGVVVFLLALPIAAFFGQPELTAIVQWMSVTFVLNGLSTQFKVQINRQLRFGRLALIELISPAIGTVCAIWVAYATNSVWAIVVLQISTALTGLLLSVGFAHWLPGMPVRDAPMRGLLTFGLDLFGTQVVGYLVRNLDSIAIGRVWGAAPLGLYDRAYQVLMVPLTQLNAPLSRVAIPILARRSGQLTEFTAAIRRSSLFVSYFTGTIFAVTAALAEPIVSLLFGSQWSAAAPVLAVLAVGGVFRSLLMITFWMYTALGLTREQLKFTVVTQPILLIGILSGLPWGIVGVAVGHSVGFAVFWVVSLWWVGRVSRIRTRPMLIDSMRAAACFAVPMAVGSLAGSVWMSDPISQILCGLLAAGVAGLVVARLIPAVGGDLCSFAGIARAAFGSRSRPLGSGRPARRGRHHRGSVGQPAGHPELPRPGTGPDGEPLPSAGPVRGRHRLGRTLSARARRRAERSSCR